MNFFSLLEPVTEVVGKVVDHYLPPSMGEGERKAAQLKAKLAIQQIALAENSAFRDFMLEYEGRAKDLPKSMRILRASVRPILTYLLIGYCMAGMEG